MSSSSATEEEINDDEPTIRRLCSDGIVIKSTPK